MDRVTTPTHTFNLHLAADTCQAIQVTYRQDNRKLVKLYRNNTLPSGMTLDGNYVYVRLTQEETGAFSSDTQALVQVRVKTADNNVKNSKIRKININDPLDEEIL